MMGELKKLGTPLGVLKRRAKAREDVVMKEAEEGAEGGKWDGEELEVAEVVRWKLVFAGRPEPVGSAKAVAVV